MKKDEFFSELPAVGSIVLAEEENGIEPEEDFQGTCMLRLRFSYNDEKWNIVNDTGGLICFLEKQYSGRKIHAIEIEAQRERAVIGRPTKYDFPKCFCPGGNYPGCTDWRHWFHMSFKAKELMLKDNPDQAEYLESSGHPSYISAGWDFWEAMAEKELAADN